MSGDKDGLLYWPKLFLNHSSTSFASWVWLLNRGSMRAQSPLSGACSHFGILSPTVSNHLGTWLYYFLTYTCFHCSSAYSHRCISWLTARSRVSIKQCFSQEQKCKVKANRILTWLTVTIFRADSRYATQTFFLINEAVNSKLSRKGNLNFVLILIDTKLNFLFFQVFRMDIDLYLDHGICKASP